MYTEKNTGTNLPAQIEIYATDSGQYDFLFMAKGGGSANKTFLYQQTKALLNPEKLLKFVDEKIKVSDCAVKDCLIRMNDLKNKRESINADFSFQM